MAFFARGDDVSPIPLFIFSARKASAGVESLVEHPATMTHDSYAGFQPILTYAVGGPNG